MSDEVSREWAAIALKSRCADYALNSILDPEPGSTAAADDLLYRWEKCSAWTRGYISAACEHLTLWANIVLPLKVEDDAIVSNSPRPYFSLGRSALESAVQAVWILEPADPETRALRHLRLVYDDLREMSLGLKASGDESYRIADERMTDLLERLPEGTPAKSIKGHGQRPRYLGMIRECAPRINRTPDALEAIWRCASAATHGKNWFVGHTSELEVGEEYEPGYFRATVRPGPDEVTKTMEAAADMTFYAVGRFAQWTGRDFAAYFDAALARVDQETPKK